MVVDDPIPSFFLHSSVSDWVILKAMELKHYIGVSCKGFEDGFMALLTTIDA